MAPPRTFLKTQMSPKSDDTMVTQAPTMATAATGSGVAENLQPFFVTSPDLL
eukprot:CAMPEP_0177654248 /NCGR_PEP_ID=MMETSP0447-20121125/14210_1 /TAXON_ID=0 /ORGANISM="Stygamoeba regulata, Strain BSH-02190019" /LENGTH=51 /DNA_ID=CAMNT_0019157843 /DNA_START=326 /DNA_END=481 /DNA_ORIENTATION=+